MIRKHDRFEYTPDGTPLTETRSMLRLAANGDEDGLEEVIPIFVNTKDRKWGLTPLMGAAVSGSMHAVTFLIDEGAQLDAQDMVRIGLVCVFVRVCVWGGGGAVCRFSLLSFLVVGCRPLYVC